MELIKVNSRIGNRLNELLSDSRYNKESIFKQHIDKGWEEENNKILNKLDSYQMAKCLFEGFEIQYSPEEEIIENFKIIKQSKITDIFDKGYVNGYNKGVKMVLDSLGKVIEGIND